MADAAQIVAAGVGRLAQGPARCCSCTARSTTTGRSPRASSTPASTSPRRPCARWPRRPGSTCGWGRRCPSATRCATASPREGRALLGRPRAWAATTSSTYKPNDEIDEVAWVHLDKAPEPAHLRARPRDARRVRAGPHAKTHPLVVLRHGKARARKAWRTTTGTARSPTRRRCRPSRRCPILAAYGVTGWCSVEQPPVLDHRRPYADVAELDLEVTGDLSEEDATPRAVARHVHRLLERPEPAVLCTHRPVLPDVYDALGVGRPGARPRRDARRAPPQRPDPRAGAAPRRDLTGSGRLRLVHVTPPRRRLSVAETETSVHPSFTRLRGSLHLSP